MEKPTPEFQPIANTENLWKSTVTEGTPEIKDNQDPTSLWTGKPRSIIIEFKFTLTGEAMEPVENLDDEDPEEYRIHAENTKEKHEG